MILLIQEMNKLSDLVIALLQGAQAFKALEVSIDS